MEGKGTVLVTGGSGFLAGWCIVSLLEAGYSVRTTVRDLSRETEVREGVASATEPGGRLDVVTANLMKDEAGPKQSRVASTCCMLPRRCRPRSRRTRPS